MPKINGTYVSLHKQTGRFPYPYYKGGLEFKNNEYYDFLIKNYFDDSPESYEIKGLAKTAGPNEIKEYIAEIETKFKDKITEKSLMFTESNSAHHMTYFYVKELAGRLGEGEKLLIINFDQHKDYGSPNGKFFCGSWGSYISSAIGCDYVVVGAGKNGGIISIKSDGTEREYPVEELDKCLRERHSDCTKIYVTVDMDILTNSISLKRTNWGSGKMPPLYLRNILKTLPAEKIISADITGFPPVNSQKLDNNLELLNSYVDDIRVIAELLCSLMGIAPYV
ncbi:MAG: hypothetical protein K2J91_07150 [Lachnospiraceae bacterium]|nr:hypothetical protein [Lachnospiraceae bacterium]